LDKTVTCCGANLASDPITMAAKIGKSRWSVKSEKCHTWLITAREKDQKRKYLKDLTQVGK